MVTALPAMVLPLIVVAPALSMSIPPPSVSLALPPRPDVATSLPGVPDDSVLFEMTLFTIDTAALLDVWMVMPPPSPPPG
jgi:hypothetical protein